MFLNSVSFRLVLRSLAIVLVTGGLATAAAAEAPKPAKEENGKYFDENGAPTFNIKEDGTVDWYTYSGFRRYHAECHVCHGPDGAGSTYAPALADSLKKMSYEDFLAVVSGGRQNVGGGKESVMPSFGTNKNVMCYIDDLYVYLKARANGLPRGRPAKHDDKPDAAKQAEESCLGS